MIKTLLKNHRQTSSLKQYQELRHLKNQLFVSCYFPSSLVELDSVYIKNTQIYTLYKIFY